MASELNQLYTLKISDVLKAGEVASRAFKAVQDPFYFDDPIQRDKNFHYLYDFPVRYCAKYGEAYAPSPNIEGVAAWKFFKEYHVSAWHAIRSGVLDIVFKARGRNLKKLRHYTSFIGRFHKRTADFPHWNLFNLAVDPVHQGKGYASKMLRPMLARIENENIPCYLDTASEKNVKMYEHFGFEVLESDIIPDSDIRVWAMLRK